MSPAGAVSFGEAVRAWIRIALHSFGGPAGQIAVAHRVVVEEKGWLSERRFLHALSYCMLLPGPEAQQLVTYVGWLMHGVRGGLTAGLLFIAPGFLSILGLSLLYVGYRETGIVAAIFFGLKPAVLAIVVAAVVRLKRRAARGVAGTLLAVSAFAAIFVFGIPFPLIVVGAALAGLGLRMHSAEPVDAVCADAIGRARPSFAGLARTVSVWCCIWLVPIGILRLVTGPDSVLVDIALFFSRTALVTFGGAYAVLAYVAQRAVDGFGWLGPGEMLDGLGLAETTPGPLIMVVQFVGFLAAFRSGTGLSPVLAGVAGAIVTTWVTFAPCFLFIFAGAPWIEHLRGSVRLNAALQGITAAVVGVVLNLGAWFAVHTLFREVREIAFGFGTLPLPVPGSVDLRALVLAAAAFIAIVRFRAGMLAVLAGSAIAGLLLDLV